MTVQVYGRYILFSRPVQDPGLGCWMPNASIVWSQENEAHYHDLSELQTIFDTQPEALAFGFSAALAWIYGSFGMDEDYKGHHIRAKADQDPSNKKWVGMVQVSWNENGTLRDRMFFNPVVWHSSKEEAVIAAAEFATKWIDDGKRI